MLIIAACIAATAAVAAPAQADAWKLRVKAGGHHPHAGDTWPLKVLARSGSGRALSATVLYKVIFAGQVVATSSPYGKRSSTPYPFHGSMRDKIKWPKRSIGYQLSFRVEVRVKGQGKKHKDYAVKVRR